MTHKQLLDELCSPFVHQISSFNYNGFFLISMPVRKCAPAFQQRQYMIKTTFFLFTLFLLLEDMIDDARPAGVTSFLLRHL